MSGKFIVFEGLDGSGQSTQVAMLGEELIRQGKEVILTKEPTKDSSAGREVIDVLTHKKTAEPMALQRLFAEDRKVHLEDLILPALEQGKIVISDRYRWSTYAFGSIDCDIEKLIDLNAAFLEPDLTIYLKVRPEISIERIARRGKPVELFEKMEKLEKVSKAYADLAQKFPDAIVIDGEQSIQEVHAAVVAEVMKII